MCFSLACFCFTCGRRRCKAGSREQVLDFCGAEKAFHSLAGRVGFAPDQGELTPRRWKYSRRQLSRRQTVKVKVKVLKQTTVQKTNSERRNVLTHRRWLKRVWTAERWVSCGHQLLEISLELVQIWAVIKWLWQWNVSCKVSEDRLLLVDWLCLPPVVVNVRLERCWLDAVGEKDINERKNIQFQGNFSTKMQFELTLRWEVVEVGLMNVPSISEKSKSLYLLFSS